MDVFALQNRFQSLLGRAYTRLCRNRFGTFGPGSQLFFPCRVHRPDRVHVGEKTLIFPQVWLNPVDHWAGEDFQGEIHIGDHSHILHNVQITAAASVRIGNHVSVGRFCVIADHIHDYRVVSQAIQAAPLGNIKPVTIGDECYIGVNSVIAPGATIGKHCFIASGSLVRDAIPDYTMAAGSPAKPILRYDPATQRWEKCRTCDDQPNVL